MANKDKKAAKEAARSAAKAVKDAKTAAAVVAPVVTEPVKTEPAVAPVTPATVETPTSEVAPTPPPVEKPVEAPNPAPTPVVKPQPKSGESKKEKAVKAAAAAEAEAPKPTPEVITPVVVSEAAAYSKLTDVPGNERFSHTDALKLTELIKAEFGNDPNATKEQKEFAACQVKGMLLTEALFYNAQVQADFQTLGIKVTNKMFTLLETQAQEYLGITLVGVPVAGNPQQTMIDFGKTEIAPEVAAAIVADKKAREEVFEIPDANPALSDDEKMKIIRAIMSQKAGRGVNFVNGLEWAKKAFELTDANPAQTLAVVLEKFNGSDPTLLSGTTNAVYAKFTSDHNILSAHALLKMWFTTYNDENIAQLVKVFLARGIEKIVTETNLRSEKGKHLDIANSFAIANRRIVQSTTDDVIAGILAKNETLTTKSEDGKDETLLNGLKCFNAILAAYGNSESIAIEKLSEIAKYYSKPIDRLAAYKDKSAYAA